MGERQVERGVERRSVRGVWVQGQVVTDEGEKGHGWVVEEV